MRTIVSLASAAALLFAALPGAQAKTPAAGKSAGSSIVIVFKDGHRQSFNLSDIARVEFAGASETMGSASNEGAARGRYVGRWVVGDGNGNTFIINLKDDGNAERSIHDIHGTWTYVNGEARVTWDDGAQDAIRKEGSGFEKFAYRAGKSFSDEPDNVTKAQNTTPKPI